MVEQKVLPGLFYFISKLILKMYIYDTMENRYTISDLQTLGLVLQGRHPDFDSLTYYLEVMDTLKQSLRENMLEEGVIEKSLKTWLIKKHFKNLPAILKFIFKTEFKKVALAINNEDLKLFIEWRLKISK
mgnify:FL=1